MTEEEGEVIIVQSEHRAKNLEDCSLSLLERFHKTKPINFRAAKNLLHSVWKMGNDMKITKVGDGLFQFKFAMQSQLNWVISNNHILLLQRWEKGMMAFLVKFLNVPIYPLI